MTRLRRSFTAEFRFEASSLVLDQGYSVPDASRSLHVGERFCHMFLAHKTGYELYLLNGCACVGIWLGITAGCKYFPANSHYHVGHGDRTTWW